MHPPELEMTTWRITQPNPPSWVVISDEVLAPAKSYPESPFMICLRPETFTTKRRAVEFIRKFSKDTLIQFDEADDSRQCSVYPGRMVPKNGFLDE